MTKTEFLTYCHNTYGTTADYPFPEDFETAVLRHGDNRKWYALVMRLPRHKLGFDSWQTVDVVNLKLPTDLFGSFTPAEGVYPAYHMNKAHWLSVCLDGSAPDEAVDFLLDVSFKATLPKISKRLKTK